MASKSSKVLLALLALAVIVLALQAKAKKRARPTALPSPIMPTKEAERITAPVVDTLSRPMGQPEPSGLEDSPKDPAGTPQTHVWHGSPPPGFPTPKKDGPPITYENVGTPDAPAIRTPDGQIRPLMPMKGMQNQPMTPEMKAHSLEEKLKDPAYRKKLMGK